VGRLKVVQATPYMQPGKLLADSPVKLAKESIGIGLAAEEFMSTHFRDGGFPANVVYSDQELDTTAAEGLKARILAAISGNREPLILGSGLRWEVPSVDSPAWAIDLLRFEIEQAARFFGIPPTMIYGSISGQAVTYSNLTQSETSFLKLSLKSWMEDLEVGWSALLPGSQRVRFNADDFLRMDAETRHKDQAVRLASKTATINEIRLEEDRDPFDGEEWDEPGIPGGAPPVPAVEVVDDGDVNDEGGE
jgi:HK97 family phage portal protein